MLDPGYSGRIFAPQKARDADQTAPFRAAWARKERNFALAWESIHASYALKPGQVRTESLILGKLGKLFMTIR
jgi:hypothetical protein